MNFQNVYIDESIQNMFLLLKKKAKSFRSYNTYKHGSAKQPKTTIVYVIVCHFIQMKIKPI